MLLSFRVANHRSLLEEQELSLVATEFSEEAARETGARHEGRPLSVLPAVGIFGSNASGKSNVLSALRFMRSAVLESFADWSKRPGTPREPFALDVQAAEETSYFEVDLLLGTRPIRYTYGFELSDERVEAEWLHAYPSGRRQVWFDREAGRPESEGGEFHFRGSGLRGPKDHYVQLTRPNALFLTVAAAMNHPQLSAIHRWFADNLWLVTSDADLATRTEWTREKLVPDESFRAHLATLLSRSGRTAEACARYRDLVDVFHRSGTWAPQWVALRTVVDLLERVMNGKKR